MKHKNKYIVLGMVLLVLAFGFLFKDKVADAVGGRFVLNTSESNPANTSGAVISTTTLNYLSPGAGTTTATFDTRTTDLLNVNIFGVASTVATTDLRFTIEYSHSTSTVDS